MKEIFQSDKVNYVLRTYLPIWNYDERIEEIVRFCNKTGTRHVMLFTDAQHMVWNQLLLDEAQHEADNIAKAKSRLAQEGISIGINSSYNMTMSRWDQRSKLDYDFWATNADGSSQYRSPCLLDPKLDIYLKKYFKILAEVEPDYIHIDDDHRYVLVHASKTWGCFCDLHINKFSKKTHHKWTRETLNNALLSDQAVRSQWINFLGSRLIEIGEIISDTIHNVNPEIEVGMMVPCVTPLTVMGHTITNVLESFAPVNKPVVRPCIGPYCDRDRRQIIPGLFYMELIGHILGDNVDYTPEIETTPFTRLSKSTTVIRFHITQALLNRMNNPAISLCGYVGDSPFLEPAYADLLKDNRDYFEGVRKLAPERGTRKGIQLLWDFDSAKSNPHEINNVMDLAWPAFAVHDFLGNLGFSTTYDESSIKFIVGDTAYALPEKKINEYLTSVLILDASAARALADRGFADLIGCQPEKQLTLFGAEKCIDKEFFGDYADSYISLKETPLDSVFDLAPQSNVRILSQIVNHDLKEIGSGVIMFENRLGGKIVVLPYKLSCSDSDLRHMICYHRQQMFKNIFNWLAPQAIPLFVEAPKDFAVQCWSDSNTITACLTNISYDVTDEITISIQSDKPISVNNASFIADDGKITPLADLINDLSSDKMIKWQIKGDFPIFKPFIILIRTKRN